MKKVIPFLRARRQKSGRVYYYFEHGSVAGQRIEKPLGTDLNEAILAWQLLMKVSAAEIPQRPSVVWLIKRFGIEHLPLIKPQKKQHQMQQELDRLHRFFATEMHCNLTAVSTSLAQFYKESTRHLHRGRRDWSLLVMISKWAYRVGYLHQALDIPSLGLTEAIKQREQDELRQLLFEHASIEESMMLQSARAGGSYSNNSKRIFEAARQQAIQQAIDRKRNDLVLALGRFKWADFRQRQT
jgi:hypothetical protein